MAKNSPDGYGLVPHCDILPGQEVDRRDGWPDQPHGSDGSGGSVGSNRCLGWFWLTQGWVWLSNFTACIVRFLITEWRTINLVSLTTLSLCTRSFEAMVSQDGLK